MNINPFIEYKSLFLLLVLLAFGCKSNSQETNKEIDNNAVTWNPDFEKALAEAKKEGKLLFVECYSPTCPHCQAVEPFFKKPEVAKKYNSNFVNYKLDVGIPEQVKHINDRNIWLPNFPLFLFFDGDGKLVHQSGAEANLESIIGNADEALDPNERSESYTAKFEAGENSIDFLAEYAYYGRVIKDTMLTLNAAKKLFEVYPKDKIGSEESWKLTKKAVNDIDNGFAKYWFNHIKEATAFEAKEGHPENTANILGGILQGSIFSNRGKTYDVAKLHLVKDYMQKIGAGQYADNTTWELEVNALIRENKEPQAISIGQRTVNNFKDNGSAIVYVTRIFNDSYPGNEFIATGKKWLAQALPLINQDNVRAEYFYELARLEQKNGENAKAKENAKAAMDISAKTASPNPKFKKLYSEL